MEKSNLRNFSRFAPGLKKTIDILFWIDIVILSLMLIGGITILFLPEKYFYLSTFNSKGLGLSLSLDNIIYYRVNPSFNGDVSLIQVAKMFLFMGASLMLILAPVLRELSGILGTVINSSPFDALNSKRISRIGYVIIAGAFLVEAANVATAYSVIKTFNLNDFNVNYSIVNIKMLLCGLLILILAQVFKYGSYLQKEYDSTI